MGISNATVCREEKMKRILEKIPMAKWSYRFVRRLAAYPRYLLDFYRFKRLAARSEGHVPVRWRDLYPCLDDRTSTTGFDRHYVYHPAWAAGIVAELNPSCHVDISSTLHFCTIVSAFIPVRFLDYRPAELNLDNLYPMAGDLRELPFPDGSIESLSCMHVLEHIGLGRYGDRLDPDGDRKAIVELKRVLAPGGALLVVVPVGVTKIMFNAHRVYSYDQVMEYFSDLVLDEFALVPDSPEQGGLIRHATKVAADAQVYGCGCFFFRRKE